MDAKILGNRIASARKAQNMSQAQLAALLFISPQAVGKWERGESIPDFITINQLAEIFTVELSYFIGAPQFTNDESITKNTSSDDDANHGTQSYAEVERQLLTDFSGSSLAEADFVGVYAPKRRFLGSDLRNTDFSKADFTGSSFKGSDLHSANFTEANLKDCIFFANNLSDAIFNKTILIGTDFRSSELTAANFMDSSLINVKISATDLTKTVFSNCSFKGMTFRSCDMSGTRLDGQVFVDVMFDRVALTGASFKGATFRSVSFRSSFALTNRYYKALKTINFEGAMMDKLTYAALKGLDVDLSQVTTLS